MKHVLIKRFVPVAVLVLATMGFAAPAQAAFPGANGKLAWTVLDYERDWEAICTAAPGEPVTFGSCDGATTYFDRDPAWSSDGARIALAGFGEGFTDDGEIFLRNADGSGDTQLTSGPGYDSDPAWAPGDLYLTFEREQDGNSEIYSMDATGGAETNITNHPADDFTAAPGPTGKIAFASERGGNTDIYAMDPDGSNVTRLTDDPGGDGVPNWSPDGSRIAFTSGRDGNSEIYVMEADGSNETRLTTTPTENEILPAWSPDGQQIAFVLPGLTCCEGTVGKINADGSGRQTLFTSDGNQQLNGGLDWQPLPVNTASTHVRPAGASPLRISLVPAAQECTAPNRTHGPPLAFGSCAPVQPGSPNLTVGVGDGSPAFARSVGHVRIAVNPGVPGGVDDTDVGIRFSLSNVMNASDLSEYTGELRASAQVRLTDREAPVAQTTVGFPLEFDVPCVGTAPTIDKSLCELTTTLDAVMPGAAAEGTRAVWALDQVKVYDGGPDGDADTTADNSLFAVQGVFVP